MTASSPILLKVVLSASAGVQSNLQTQIFNYTSPYIYMSKPILQKLHYQYHTHLM